MAAFQKKITRFVCRGMNLNTPLDQIPENEFALLQNVRTYFEGRIESRPGLINVSDQFTVVDQYDTIHSMYTVNDFNPDSTGTSKRFFGYNTELWWSDVTNPAVVSNINSGYSGNPLSMIAFSPEINPLPFLYVYDSLRQDKYSSAYLVGGNPEAFQIGVPQSAVYAAGAPVPTQVGGGGAGLSYQWRWQLRHSITGNKSIPSVATYTPLDVDFASGDTVSFPDPAITITGTLALDQQYYWDLYRKGGALGNWTYISTVQNRTGNIITDANLDIDIASNPTLDVSPEGILYQPWLSPDIPRSGVTTATAAAVATTSGVTGGDGSLITGSGFNVNWIPGTAIIVGGFPLTVARVISTNNLYVNEDLGTNLGAVDWSEIGALQSNQPLPYVWGPYGTGQQGLYLFGCGDPRAAGTLYWTNGNDPDSVSITGSIEITDVSEPLQNGCVWNGRVWVWSVERMWEVMPDFSNPGQFIAQVVPGAKGLYPSQWCFCVGDLIYWLSKDGLYRFGGGGLPESLSDHQLNQLLGHDNNQGQPVFIPNPENFANDIIIEPPDPNRPQNLRLQWAQGVLHFDYIDTNAQPLAFLYDSHIMKGWTQDVFHPSGLITHHSEDGHQDLLIGIGNVLYQSANNDDDGQDIVVRIMTGADVLGDFRSQKLIGDAIVGALTNSGTVTARVLSDYNRAILASDTLTASGIYEQTIISVDFSSSDTATNALSRTCGLWIYSLSQVAMYFYDWEPSFVPKMDITEKRATDWTDDGEPGDKYLYGCLIEANTFGAARTVEIHGDNNTLIATLTVNHAIQATKPYSFSTPMITHQMRVVPTDANSWELFRIIWKWTKKPELTDFIMDWTDDGIPAPKYLQGFVLEGDTGGTNVTMDLYGDGQLIQTFTVNHNGQLEKPYPCTTPPIVHEMRLVPSGNTIRYWDVFKIAWIYVKQPEFTAWVPDFTGKDPYSFRGVAIEADTHGATISVQVVTENGVQRTLSVTHSGRQQKAYTFLEPFIATEIKLIPLGDWAQYPDWIVRWIADPRPDLAALYSDWTDDGYQSSKFMQGFSLSADTQGADITFTVEYDGGQVGGVFTKVNHNGWMEIEYSFPTPFIAHLVRTIPSGDLRYLGPWKIRWIWEPAPDLAKNWITQTTSHDLRGYHHHRDTYIALQSYADVLLKLVMDDGSVFNYIIPSTGGNVRKPYQILAPAKGKLSQYNLISCKPFRLFKKDCEVRVKEWGSTGEYLIARPFGGDHFRDGAAI